MKKICFKCGNEYPATLEYFYADKGHKDKLRSWCKICDKKYRQTEKGKIAYQKYQREYQETITGHLRHIYAAIKYRCNNFKCKDYKNYGGRGIELRFTVDEFLDYVINDMKVDPRGLEIHRIDSDGHYKKGNIEFLTPKEHGLKHREINNRRKR